MIIKLTNIIEEANHLPTGFNVKYFNKLKDFVERKKYITSELHLKSIGSGAGRFVYKINDKYILKFSYNKEGLHQTNEEIKFYNKLSNSDKKFFPIIYFYDNNGYYMIEENCKAPTVNQFEKLAGIDKYDYYYWAQKGYKKYGDMNNFIQYINKKDKKIYQPTNNFLELSKFLYKNKGLMYDINDTLYNFGINKKGNIVITDFGVQSEKYKFSDD